MGLTASTLHLLLSGPDKPLIHDSDKSAHLQYEFEGCLLNVYFRLSVVGTAQHFHPKILLTVEDNLALSADLDPETKKTLEDLMKYPQHPPSHDSERVIDVTDSEQNVVEESASEQVPDGNQLDDDIFQTDEDLQKYPHAQRSRQSSCVSVDGTFVKELGTCTIEITLQADTEFFNLLKDELASIDKLQAEQKETLTSQVKNLGREVVAVTKPTKHGSRSDLYAWRDIFKVYQDAAVFFATTERDHGARTAVQARDRVKWFSSQLTAMDIVRDTLGTD